MLKDKTLKLINVKLNSGLLKALNQFILQVSKGGVALDSVVLALNSLNDVSQGEILYPLSSFGSKTRSIYLIGNLFAEKTLESLLKIIK
jgi:hypothetical protein